MSQLAAGDHVVDVALGQISGGGADVPVVFKSNRAHAAFGGFDGDLDHVLRAMNKIGISVNMTIDRAVEQFVLDPRIDLQHLRVVLQHLIEIILGVELAHSRDAQVRPTINSSAAFASAAKSHIFFSS